MMDLACMVLVGGGVIASYIHGGPLSLAITGTAQKLTGFLITKIASGEKAREEVYYVNYRVK
ncbi:MAG: hypothetical protein A4E65_01561 [Syntrophorhabdus sp. PtaU1.Bin153]|nr:MAG: hypothetical protein A4E65_01561 [Syntrophorhabdus sp. PtaU1.Bin153]